MFGGLLSLLVDFRLELLFVPIITTEFSDWLCIICPPISCCWCSLCMMCPPMNCSWSDVDSSPFVSCLSSRSGTSASICCSSYLLKGPWAVFSDVCVWSLLGLLNWSYPTGLG
uniref:Secreted protein n=1 Tax=Cacopsylla melanoneura TaxID=428564 RepID=A0A8D8ZD98_9HEMI